MKAEILSIGTEILLGQITDTNASHLAFQLPVLGIDLLWVTQVGDNLGRLVESIERAWLRSELVLTTGGLGPTEDDLTREAIAQVLGEELRVDPTLERELREFFSGRGFTMPESNIKQATLVPSAVAIPNPRGTAPGWWVERDGKLLIAMPGPPSEMQRMWQKEVSPRLKARLGHGIILSRTLKTLLMAESAVDEMVSPYLSSPNPSLAVYAKPDGIHLRITAKADTLEEAQALVDTREADVRSLIGDNVWGLDEDTMEGVVGQLLAEKGLSLAVMESCTGGLLSSMITDVPGSSSYFKGGIVAYASEVKTAHGVDPALIATHGTVSAEVAAAMAHAAREGLGADIGVGLTGVAGPSPVEGKPPGVAYIAIDDGQEVRVA
ncbi:MAG: competence/damage-inducible protein A, partial [Chloroflexota bacterium]|nr:competence/damage-inducible protein A [Chloroflexota bacterium]